MQAGRFHRRRKLLSPASAAVKQRPDLTKTDLYVIAWGQLFTDIPPKLDRISPILRCWPARYVNGRDENNLAVSRGIIPAADIPDLIHTADQRGVAVRQSSSTSVRCRKRVVRPARAAVFASLQPSLLGTVKPAEVLV